MTIRGIVIDPLRGSVEERPLPLMQVPEGTEPDRSALADILGVETPAVAGGYQTIGRILSNPRSRIVTYAKERDRRKGMDYFAKPVEIFARAFEIYVAEKAEALGYDISSLVGNRTDLPSYDDSAEHQARAQRTDRGVRCNIRWRAAER